MAGLRLGLIGAGSIAASIARYVRATERFEIAGILARSPERVGPDYPHARIVTTVADLLATGPQLIVECAGHAAVAAYVPAVLRAGIDVVLASTGSLADPVLWDAVSTVEGRGRLIVPPGALVGMDGLSAAARNDLAEVSLTSTKPPRAWAGTPAADAIDLDALSGPYTLFQGTAREAARRFPKNANVAATVALAGIGFERTVVRLVADPHAQGNTHVVEASGAFGKLSARIEANASPSNPKTSYMTALSIIRAVEMQFLTLVL